MRLSAGLATEPSVFNSALSISSVARLAMIHFKSGWSSLLWSWYMSQTHVAPGTTFGTGSGGGGLWEKEAAVDKGETQSYLSEVCRSSQWPVEVITRQTCGTNVCTIERERK